MYPVLLSAHSLIRWMVLGALLLAIFRSFYGWRTARPFSPLDDRMRHWTATLIHIQLAVGIALYAISPIIVAFFGHFPDSIRNREIRFFGMEHSVTMFLAILIVTVGSMVAKRKKVDHDKFKTVAITFAIALVMIFASVPWPFSPIVVRPLLRMF